MHGFATVCCLCSSSRIDKVSFHGVNVNAAWRQAAEDELRVRVDSRLRDEDAALAASIFDALRERFSSSNVCSCLFSVMK